MSELLIVIMDYFCVIPHLCDTIYIVLMIFRWYCVVCVVLKTGVAILRFSAWFALLLRGSPGVTMQKISWFSCHDAGGSSVYAKTICLGKCTRMVKKLLNTIWNAWLGRASATLRAGNVSFRLADKCRGNAVSKPEAFVATMMAVIVFCAIIICWACRTECVVVGWKVGGRVLWPVEVWRTIKAPIVDALFGRETSMATDCGYHGTALNSSEKISRNSWSMKYMPIGNSIAKFGTISNQTKVRMSPVVMWTKMVSFRRMGSLVAVQSLSTSTCLTRPSNTG